VNTVKRILLFILLFVLVVIALPLLFPLVIGGIISTWINTSQFKEQYKAFLKGCDGYVFYCYSDRSQKQVYVQENILPHLDPSLNIIYVQGREPQSDFNQRFISIMLDSLTSKGCPNLIRISDGQVLDVSLHKAWELAIEQENDPAKFVQIIHSKVEELKNMVEG
jgi:hypothetical protein